MIILLLLFNFIIFLSVLAVYSITYSLRKSQFYVILKLFEDYLRILHNKISFDSCAQIRVRTPYFENFRVYRGGFSLKKRRNRGDFGYQNN